MRHNNRTKPSNRLENYDQVYFDAPNCPWIRRIVVEPLKTVYINRSRCIDTNIDYMFRNVEHLINFCEKYNIDLIG